VVQHETLILAAIAAPAQAEPVTIVVTASAHSAYLVEQSPEQPIHSGLLDVLGDAGAHGSGSVTPTIVQPQSIVAPQLEALPSTLAHVASPLDIVPSLAAAGTAGSLSPSVSVTLPVPASPDMNLTGPVVLPGAHFVPLTVLSDLPKSDLDLLHALSVPSVVQYVPTLPAPLSKVLEGGVHSNPVHSPDAHAPSAGTATSPAVADAGSAHGSAGALPAATATTVPTTTTTTNATSATAAAMAPDMSAVLVAVEQFQSAAQQPALVMTDHAAIFYDAAATTSSFGAVKSITYDFDNGFSVSLVGLPTELAHVALHV
jgi:hypothetical protein